jgi:hypothetical protein
LSSSAPLLASHLSGPRWNESIPGKDHIQSICMLRINYASAAQDNIFWCMWIFSSSFLIAI